MRFVIAFIIAFAPLASQALSARVVTDQGTFMFALWQDRAPKTVENFVKLAKGEIKFTEPDGKKAMRPFYNGLTIYRVNPDLGIFMGCPWNNGRGGPGYTIEEEPMVDFKFDKPGIVAMAKVKGEKRYGSQFFITTAPLPHLDGQYTAFGEVSVGLDIVKKISKAAHNSREIPTKPVTIKAIEIVNE